MSVSTPGKLESLRNVLAKSPDRDVLHKYLQRSNTGLLRDAVLVTLHRKWSATPPHRLTELGITTYDRASTKQGQPIAGPHAEDLLRQVWSLHLVIRSTAHLDSTLTGLDPFHFGTTVYVSHEEALQLLQYIWHQPMDEKKAESGFRPIVYMSFGANDSISKMRKTAFDFDPSSKVTTIATLDAQVIPQQAKITRHADASFTYLLQQFKIPVHHPQNSGNAAMYATIIATLSAIRFEIYSCPLSLSALAVAARASTQDVFEPADFNVTEALMNDGVDVSAIPELAGLVVRSSSKGCSIACDSLKLVFGANKTFDTAPTTYWSIQQLEVEPYCTFTPTAALEVSSLVLIARLTQCPFAIKSGGHAAFPGASSIEGGITVDMVNMNQKRLSADKTFVAVGPGNRWKEVYDYLTPYNLAIVGGRAAYVGVGGLTLGGGISHHTNEYGLACDNIASFELVTASGVILTVSQKTFPDLYWALRGGGNNFGIITTFNYETLPQGLMFASKRQYNATYAPALFDAFGNAVKAAETDTKLAHFVAVAYSRGVKIASTEYEYFDPIDPANPPAILNEYLSLPPLTDNTRNCSLADTTPGLSQSMPDGFRTTMWSQSFKLNTDLMKRMTDHLFEIAPNIPVGAPSVSFQAFSKPALKAMQKKGGNALGLHPENGPLFHALFYLSWTDEKDDKVVLEAAQDFLSASVAMAKELGAYNDYMYMPYSSPYQPVISGYGLENVAKLNKVSRKYDPAGIFQKLQPGYFKLDGMAPYGQIM
ncbi:unnamed protein product [Alternaria alternata]